MSFQLWRDDWGIPHLRADGSRALAFAQGRVTAVDRAWQLEVERHRSQGTTAGFLGAEALGWDEFARRSRLEDTARRCFQALEARARETAAWIQAYVDGVNAGLAEGTSRAPEFTATGLAPGQWQPWTPLAIWLSTHILFAGFPTKLWREHVARTLGEQAVELFHTDGPATCGSNGWLVTGEHTASGAPIIAGDPHRFFEEPGIYQQIHLSCPEYDVVGLAVPGVPGIAHFGHTGHVAWAITNAMADYQDLYTERLRRTGRGGFEARGPDGWHPAAVHTETIEVRGQDPVEIEIVETERGPVIIGGPDQPVAVSLRVPARVRADLGFQAIPKLLGARTVAHVDAAFDDWVEPVNVVLAADTEGGLLHRTAGAVPLRHRDNQLRLVPAWAPDHVWQGWHDLPRTKVDGIAVMANERSLAAPLGVEFAPPHRAQRIRKLLEGSTAWSAKSMAAIHTDTLLTSTRPLLDLLGTLGTLTPEAEYLRNRLLAWDRHMAADSDDATVYAALRSSVVRRLSTHPVLASLAEPPLYPEILRPFLAQLPRVAFALEHLLTAKLLPASDLADTVRAALEETAQAPGLHGVPWSERHRFAPWQAIPSAKDRPGLAGDHDCVLSTSSVPGLTYHSARGPCARYAWDLKHRDDSYWVVPFGASGVPDDPHHDDQLAHWLNGELIPVLTDFTQLHLVEEIPWHSLHQPQAASNSVCPD